MDAAAAQMERHSSAAAFVEGGVQDGCDDACSICLEAFSDSDPSAVTSCKHEFHLQCILEWCQRSSQCPMCWQAISMKDPTSQELLEAVEEERNDVQENHARTTTVFRHPLLGDFEVPVDADDAEIEERIMQHLAAAAAIRRSHRHARREGRRSSRAPAAHGHGHPQTQVLFFPSAGEATPGGSGSPSPHPRQEHAASSVVSPPPLPAVASAEGTDVDSTASADGAVGPDDSVSRRQSSPVNHDEAGPSADAQSFSDTIKSRLQSVSTKYKDSITKSTRGWKERWFAQSSAMSNLGSEMRREVGAGIAAVSRMIEKQLETRDGSGTAPSSATASSPAHAHPGPDASSSQGAAVPATPPAAALNNATPAAAAALNDASSSSTA